MFSDFFNLDSVLKSWVRPLTEANGYEVRDTEKGQLVVMNAIGVDKKDLKVDIVGKNLVVNGETELKELGFTTKTNFKVPVNIDLLDNVDYKLINGYLYIYLNAKKIDKKEIKINYKD